MSLGRIWKAVHNDRQLNQIELVYLPHFLLLDVWNKIFPLIKMKFNKKSTFFNFQNDFSYKSKSQID